jgi:hypothetical protein
VRLFQGQVVVAVAAVGYNSHSQCQGESAEAVGLKIDPTQSGNLQMLEDSCYKVAGHTVGAHQGKLQAACIHNQAAVLLAHQVPSYPEDEEGDSLAEDSHLTLDFWHDSAKIEFAHLYMYRTKTYNAM